MTGIWRTGIDPERTGRGLRGIGLVIIVLAFLTASNKFVSGTDKKATTPVKAGPVVVYADGALQPVLPVVDRAPKYTFALAATVVGSGDADKSAGVIISANTAAIDNLVKRARCAQPVVLAIDSKVAPPLTYRACATARGGRLSPAARSYVSELAGIKGRAAFLDAGFDLPPIH